MSYAENNGVRIHYRVVGAGSLWCCTMGSPSRSKTGRSAGMWMPFSLSIG